MSKPNGQQEHHVKLEREDYLEFKNISLEVQNISLQIQAVQQQVSLLPLLQQRHQELATEANVLRERLNEKYHVDIGKTHVVSNDAELVPMPNAQERTPRSQLQ